MLNEVLKGLAKCYGSSSAINESWICAPGNGSENCTFLFYQQFNRPLYCSYADVAINVNILALSLPVNIAAAAGFWKVKPELFVLTLTLAVINVMSAFLSTVKSLQSVYTDEWVIFGDYGCIAFALVSGSLVPLQVVFKNTW